MLSQGRFASDKGKCESFGEGGDGYVPAEGVGVVLLKPLSAAIAAGDRIYGVILGTGLNHGGKTNGYTVPNPTAQAAVIKEAIERAGVKVEDFGYIEAHGTGTTLGDPIEIAGLSHAFKNTAKAGQYCSIGSVKSNIGHGESAAGISGLKKVLFQLKYRQLVPSLHSETLNKQINFEKTPFRVQQQLEEWRVENNKPRLAGISSFGAGGSNAHLVVEEYIQEVKEYRSESPAIILLSAKNESRLKEQVLNLQGFLNANEHVDIYDVAYTLQTGREAMEERLAFVADDIKELNDRLTDYTEGRNNEFLFRGNSKDSKRDFILKGKAGEAYLREATKNKELESLAQLWVNGVDIDWHLLYEAGSLPLKIGLPTYPFARDRYWVPGWRPTALISPKKKLHPLLHFNTANTKEIPKS